MGSCRAVLHYAMEIGVLFGCRGLSLLCLFPSFGDVLQSALPRYAALGGCRFCIGLVLYRSKLGLSYFNTYLTVVGGRG
jgi:hypothetical protein